jgi:hypothetical protein
MEIKSYILDKDSNIKDQTLLCRIKNIVMHLNLFNNKNENSFKNGMHILVNNSIL